MEFVIMHHKSRSWADYVIKYSKLAGLKAAGITVTVKSLPQKNADLDYSQLPESLQRLLFLANPDVVVCFQDDLIPLQPIFSIDVTEHVPARDHWIQRFPNLVGCVQEGIPGAFVAPGDMPHRPNFAGKVDPLFYYVYDRVVEIHQTPVYIAQWPSSDGSTLDKDPAYPDMPNHAAQDIKAVFDFLDLVIDYAIHGRDFSHLMKHRLIVDLRSRLRSVGYAKQWTISDFDRLAFNMPLGDYLSFSDVQTWITSKGLSLPVDLPDRILKRSRNIIFVPQSSRRGKTVADLRKTLLYRIDKKNGDPYTQQPLMFDYLFCRLGRTPLERDANLILDLSVLKFEDFAKYINATWSSSPLSKTDLTSIGSDIPIYTMHLSHGILRVVKQFVRLYASSADIIVFEDGVLYF